MSAGGLIVLVLSLILSYDAYGISLTTTLCTLAGFCVLVYGVLYLATAPGTKPVGCVTEIVVYPLKSARGVSVQSHALDNRGLKYDRLWMVVDEDGAFLSQRRAPKLATVTVELPTSDDDPLKVSAPHMRGSLVVPVVTSADGASTVRCWEDRCGAIDQGDEAARWFAAALGVDGARLVRMADKTKRYCSNKYARSDALTAFSDGFPLLLATEASLDELNFKMVARNKEPIPMNRFRPNLVLGMHEIHKTVSSPFEEDGWGSVMVFGKGIANYMNFQVVKPCARCKMPTIDQETGVPDGRRSSSATKGTADDDDEGGGPAAMAEPTATLKTFRTGKILGYKKPGWSGDVFFGQNIVPDKMLDGSIIAVGDPVIATPRRPRDWKWMSRGVSGVDF